MSEKHKDPKSLFVEGKKAWNELYGGALAMASFWRLGFFLSVVVNIILAGGVIWSTRQSHIVPYVVEVDKLGKAVPVTPATREYGVTKTILTATVADFINRTREVIDDPLAEKDALLGVYSHLVVGSPAYTTITNFLRKRQIDVIAKKLSITVKIKAVLWKSPNTALIQWTETAWLPSGQSRTLGLYEGYVSVKVVPPTSPGIPGFEGNPLGIFINKISWTTISQ